MVFGSTLVIWILVAGDNMLEQAFIVFAITLILTKSKITSCKREYVQKTYEQTKITGKPGWIHEIWHAVWTCPMCCGFYIAFLVSLNSSHVIDNTLILFSINWLLHCLENTFFNIGKYFEKKLELSEKKNV